LENFCLNNGSGLRSWNSDFVQRTGVVRMLTRYVFFEGQTLVDESAFRYEIERQLLPMWQKMPANTGVRLTFSEARDADAPSILMVLAVDYPDHAALKASLSSAHRDQTRDRSAVVLAPVFAGRVHHHVMRVARPDCADALPHRNVQEI